MRTIPACGHPPVTATGCDLEHDGVQRQGGIQYHCSGSSPGAGHSDDSLDSIQLRLQTLASEGATHFNKANYFADRSLSERLITTQEALGGGVALARANQTFNGSPDATIPRADALAAARAASESARMGTASAAGADSDPLAGVEVDPRRAAMAFASAQNKPTAGRAEAVSPDAATRAANLAASDLSKPSAPRRRVSVTGARRGRVDRNTATLSPARWRSSGAQARQWHRLSESG